MKWQIILSGKTSTVSLWRREWDRSRRRGQPGSRDSEESREMLPLENWERSSVFLFSSFFISFMPGLPPPFVPCSPLPLPDLQRRPRALLGLLRKSAVWRWRLPCDEIFSSTLLLCVQHCAAMERKQMHGQAISAPLFLCLTCREEGISGVKCSCCPPSYYCSSDLHVMVFKRRSLKVWKLSVHTQMMQSI